MSDAPKIPREALAIHEAGHVVMAVRAGSPVRRASIDPDGAYDPSLQGGIEYRAKLTDLRTRLLVALAGLAAETLYGPQARSDATFLEVLESDGPFTGENDLDQAMTALEELPLGLSRRQITLGIRSAFEKTRDILREQEGDVRWVASRLLEAGTLEGEELDELLEQLEKRTRTD